MAACHFDVDEVKDMATALPAPPPVEAAPQVAAAALDDRALADLTNALGRQAAHRGADRCGGPQARSAVSRFSVAGTGNIRS
jgi:hypothetical protein